jgi:hypothetical protein
MDVAAAVVTAAGAFDAQQEPWSVAEQKASFAIQPDRR